ncbi:hypothetical protein [Stenotrophomonas rhizophila]|uniref:hypothetical protein n=1 Tax=Stenotrophomonas rhizophila TaxID=216778 RepID=UPI0027D7E714|nr:hypothetical protein [Stenotrophomonas rhizophila]
MRQNNKRYGDLQLRPLTRGDTDKVAGMKVGLLALALAGGGSARVFFTNNLRGDTIETVPSPAVRHMPNFLRERLAAFFGSHPEATPYDARTVWAKASAWTLTYHNLSGSDVPFELRYDSSISFLLPMDGLAQTTFYCTDELLQSPLKEWQDDYAKVRAASQASAERRVAHFVAELPKFFPPLA